MIYATSIVIPAKAGIHPSTRSAAAPWIPAFAGLAAMDLKNRDLWNFPRAP
jgi:hypothetical protein